MTKDKKPDSPSNGSEEKAAPKSCFVIMPISDADGYESGHFKRVYEYIIKPACEKAGFFPIRADDVKPSNFIVIDILKRIISSDMAICDVSSRNANVLYELGIRQAFDMPVTIMRDDTTSRLFDIQGFRDIEYDHTLRIDTVNSAVTSLADNLRKTYDSHHSDVPDVTSIISLLGVSKAELKKDIKMDPGIQLILNAIENMRGDVFKVDLKKQYTGEHLPSTGYFYDGHGNKIQEGDKVLHVDFGYITIKKINKDSLVIIHDTDPNQPRQTLEIPLQRGHMSAI